MNTYFINTFLILILFLIVSLVTVGLLCWLIYGKLILRRVPLKQELFDVDSLPVWLDFTGALIIPALFLVSVILTPSGKFIYHGKWIDLVTIVLYIVSYMIVFTIFRFCADFLISYGSKFEIKKKVSLINEIYIEKNISAALLSICVSVVAVSLLLQENFLVESYITNIIRLGVIFILTIALLSIYKSYFFPKHSPLFKELFIDRNTCTGILLLGQVTAVSLIISKSISFLKLSSSGWLNIGYIIDLVFNATSIYIIMLFGIRLIKSIINSILKVNIDKELFQQNNIGYSIFEGASYIIFSLLIVNTFLV